MLGPSNMRQSARVETCPKRQTIPCPPLANTALIPGMRHSGEPAAHAPCPPQVHHPTLKLCCACAKHPKKYRLHPVKTHASLTVRQSKAQLNRVHQQLAGVLPCNHHPLRALIDREDVAKSHVSPDSHLPALIDSKRATALKCPPCWSSNRRIQFAVCKNFFSSPKPSRALRISTIPPIVLRVAPNGFFQKHALPHYSTPVANKVRLCTAKNSSRSKRRRRHLTQARDQLLYGPTEKLQFMIMIEAGATHQVSQNLHLDPLVARFSIHDLLRHKRRH